MAKIKSIEIQGTKFYLPLEERFRRHNETERKALSDSIEDKGIRREIVTYYDKTLNLANCVLDGQGRLETAKKLGLAKAKIPRKNAGKLTTDEAYTEALVHNDARRHDDAKSIQERQSELERARLEEIAKARQEGQSIRAIAEEMEMHPKQVQRELEAAKEAGLDTTVKTDEGGQQTVVGTDGKPHKVVRPTNAWRDKPIDKFLEADEAVFRALRLAKIKTAGQLFDALEKGVRFGLDPKQWGPLYQQVNRLRPEAGKPRAKAKPGRVKGYDWRELDRALAVIVKAPSEIERLHPEKTKAEDRQALTDAAIDVGRAVKKLRDKVAKK